MWQIQSVFIPKENIHIIEQWLNYHYSIGCSHIYLYDNSESQFIDNGNNINETGKNKYGFNIKSIMSEISDEQVTIFYDRLLQKYNGKLDIVKWSPKINGKVIYGQYEAIIDYAKRFKPVTWTLFTDIDEFLYISPDRLSGSSPNENLDFNIQCKNYIEKTLLNSQLCNIYKLNLTQIKMDHHLSELENCIYNGNKFSILNCTSQYNIPDDVRYIWGIKSFVYMPLFEQKVISYIHKIHIRHGSEQLLKDGSLAFMHFNTCPTQMEWYKQHFSVNNKILELNKTDNIEYLRKNFKEILSHATLFEDLKNIKI